MQNNGEDESSCEYPTQNGSHSDVSDKMLIKYFLKPDKSDYINIPKAFECCAPGASKQRSDIDLNICLQSKKSKSTDGNDLERVESGASYNECCSRGAIHTPWLQTPEPIVVPHGYRSRRCGRVDFQVSCEEENDARKRCNDKSLTTQPSARRERSKSRSVKTHSKRKSSRKRKSSSTIRRPLPGEPEKTQQVIIYTNSRTAVKQAPNMDNNVNYIVNPCTTSEPSGINQYEEEPKPKLCPEICPVPKITLPCDCGARMREKETQMEMRKKSLSKVGALVQKYDGRSLSQCQNLLFDEIIKINSNTCDKDIYFDPNSFHWRKKKQSSSAVLQLAQACRLKEIEKLMGSIEDLIGTGEHFCRDADCPVMSLIDLLMKEQEKLSSKSMTCITTSMSCTTGKSSGAYEDVCPSLKGKNSRTVSVSYSVKSAKSHSRCRVTRFKPNFTSNQGIQTLDSGFRSKCPVKKVDCKKIRDSITNTKNSCSEEFSLTQHSDIKKPAPIFGCTCEEEAQPPSLHNASTSKSDCVCASECETICKKESINEIIPIPVPSLKKIPCACAKIPNPDPQPKKICTFSKSMSSCPYFKPKCVCTSRPRVNNMNVLKQVDDFVENVPHIPPCTTRGMTNQTIVMEPVDDRTNDDCIEEYLTDAEERRQGKLNSKGGTGTDVLHGNSKSTFGYALPIMGILSKAYKCIAGSNDNLVLIEQQASIGSVVKVSEVKLPSEAKKNVKKSKSKQKNAVKKKRSKSLSIKKQSTEKMKAKKKKPSTNKPKKLKKENKPKTKTAGSDSKSTIKASQSTPEICDESCVDPPGVCPAKIDQPTNSFLSESVGGIPSMAAESVEIKSKKIVSKRTSSKIKNPKKKTSMKSFDVSQTKPELGTNSLNAALVTAKKMVTLYQNEGLSSEEKKVPTTKINKDLESGKKRSQSSMKTNKKKFKKNLSTPKKGKKVKKKISEIQPLQKFITGSRSSGILCTKLSPEDILEGCNIFVMNVVQLDNEDDEVIQMDVKDKVTESIAAHPIAENNPSTKDQMEQKSRDMVDVMLLDIYRNAAVKADRCQCMSKKQKCTFQSCPAANVTHQSESKTHTKSTISGTKFDQDIQGLPEQILQTQSEPTPPKSAMMLQSLTELTENLARTENLEFSESKFEELNEQKCSTASCESTKSKNSLEKGLFQFVKTMVRKFRNEQSRKVACAKNMRKFGIDARQQLESDTTILQKFKTRAGISMDPCATCTGQKKDPCLNCWEMQKERQLEKAIRQNLWQIRSRALVNDKNEPQEDFLCPICFDPECDGIHIEGDADNPDSDTSNSQDQDLNRNVNFKIKFESLKLNSDGEEIVEESDQNPLPMMFKYILIQQQVDLPFLVYSKTKKHTIQMEKDHHIVMGPLTALYMMKCDLHIDLHMVSDASKKIQNFIGTCDLPVRNALLEPNTWHNIELEISDKERVLFMENGVECKFGAVSLRYKAEIDEYMLRRMLPQSLIPEAIPILGDGSFAEFLDDAGSTHSAEVRAVNSSNIGNIRAHSESVVSCTARSDMDADVKAFTDALHLVLVRNKALRTTQSEIERELNDRCQWMHEELKWRLTLQEHSILSGKDPQEVRWRQWRDEVTSVVRYRTLMDEDANYDSVITITVQHLQLLPQSTPMLDDGVSQIYIEYAFLSHSGLELETSSKPKTSNGVIHYNFEKSFPIDLKENAIDCQVLAEQIKTDHHIRFTAVHEPIEDPADFQTCFAIGACEVSLFQLAQNIENRVSYVYPMKDLRNPAQDMGKLAVNFAGMRAMRTVALKLLAPPSFTIIR